MKKKRIWSCFVLLGLLFLLAGCSDRRIYKIGVSQCSQDDWRMKMNDEINREIMFHEDAVVEIRSADDSNTKQIEDIKLLLSGKKRQNHIFSTNIISYTCFTKKGLSFEAM